MILEWLNVSAGFDAPAHWMLTHRQVVFDAAELARRYPSGPGGYAAAFREATTHAVAAGFLLDHDVDEMVAVATAAYPAP